MKVKVFYRNGDVYNFDSDGNDVYENAHLEVSKDKIEIVNPEGCVLRRIHLKGKTFEAFGFAVEQ